MEHTRRWQDWVNIFLGFWLFSTPFVFGLLSTTDVPAWDGYIFGAAIIAVSGWALLRPQAWEEWINLGFGIWLILSPLILGFMTDTVPMWNHLLIGMFVGIDALWAIPA